MPRRILQGEVVSDVCDKTVTVCVVRFYTHPLYKKTVKRSKKYKAHDEENTKKIGDVVKIRECAPYSKTKCWEVVSEA